MNVKYPQNINIRQSNRQILIAMTTNLIYFKIRRIYQNLGQVVNSSNR